MKIIQTRTEFHIPLITIRATGKAKSLYIVIENFGTQRRMLAGSYRTATALAKRWAGKYYR